MASAAAAIDQAASAKPLDESLWWDSFVRLFEELDSAPLSSDLPDHLVKKLKSSHSWFLDSVALFKPPNLASRLALNASQISVGSHRLIIKPELKEVALRASTCLCLDEVQSYILVDRSFELNKSVADVEGQEFLHLIILQYYLERQCLLKCIRRILVHALCLCNESDPSDAVGAEALQLVHDGLEKKLLSILMDLLSSVSSEKSEVEFTILWVEETFIEDNLVLDILFLAYYDNFCTCSCEQWIKLCSLFKDIFCGSFSIEKLAASVEARNSFEHAKFQLLLILIETLDLENLLRMVHDGVPFRQGCSVFSLSEIQEMDVLVSSFSILGTAEAGPLILAWAVFICLLLSLPERKDYIMLTEIDHIGYLRQSFEASPFNYLLESLHSDTLRDSDGPVSGYLSILRTLISAFIASYELNYQAEDETLNLILDILCKIYSEEESLCMQFWDRDSFVDGPIRSLLYMLESEYPFHIVELVRFLSALCTGKWSAECVYGFFEKMNGITMFFKIPGGSHVVSSYDIIETHVQLDIPNVEGLVIPSGTRGQILKIIDANVALVRWECAHSGIFLLLLHLAQRLHSSSYEEVPLILNLLHRMVSSNTALCFNLLYIDKSLRTKALRNCGHIGSNVRVDVVNIICTLIVHFVQDVSNTGLVSICINILAEMLKCTPSYVIEVVSRSNVFGPADIGLSCTWLPSGGLARMLLSDFEESGDCFLLTTSVLDFTIQLVEKGGHDNLASALIVFSLQYVLVNHMHWKYTLKCARWKVTLKVLEVMKSCIKAIEVPHKLGSTVRDIVFLDSSIHNTLCRIMCISPTALERSYVSHHYESKEVEGLQLAVHSALDIVYSLLGDLLKFQESISNAPTFVQTMLSSATKPIPIVTAAVSLITFFHNTAIQVAASRVLSMLCVIASRFQRYSTENLSLVIDNMQIRDLSIAIHSILNEELTTSEDLLIAIFDLLIYAARYQPALLVSMMSVEIPLDTAGNRKNPLEVAPIIEPADSKKSSLVDSVLKYVKRTDILINSSPRLLLSILNLLKALWDGGSQYMRTLETIRISELFWKHLSSSIIATESGTGLSLKNLNDDDNECTAYRYKCQGTVLEIMARELFLQERLLLNDRPEKQTSSGGSMERFGNRLSTEISKPSNVPHPSDILATWCEGSIIENLIKSYSSRVYDKELILHAKIAACLCTVHIVAMLSAGNAGSLSISLVEKIQIIYNKLGEHPAFSALLAQYSSRGYSEGKELTHLLLNDLYYHLQGSLEGREITPGPFQELSNFLQELEPFQCHEYKYDSDMWPLDNNVSMFDITRVRAELGIDFWVLPEWKASKEIAERMLLRMHDANLITSVTDSKCSALKALSALVSLHSGNLVETRSRVLGRGISKTLIEPSIRYMCKCLQETQDSLVPAANPPEDLLKMLAIQAELLLILSRILFRQIKERTGRKQLFPVSLLLIKASGSGIRLLADIRTSSSVLNKALKFLFMLLLTSVEFSYPNAYMEKMESEADQFAEASLTCIGLLPVLCKYAENSEYSELSLAPMDLILKGPLAPNSWLPVLQKHLQLQIIVQKIQKKEALVSIRVILNFLLTLAHTKGGSEMLYSANLFFSLKVLFSNLLDDQPFPSDLDGSKFSAAINNDEKHANLWGLGLAIVTSMIYSLGDDASYTDILDNAMRYFSEKPYMIAYYLSAPNFPDADHSKKRARTQKTKTSLTALRLTEHTLMLICVLARHQATWNRGMKEMDSELRETCIHLLAFISRGAQRTGDSPTRTAPSFCLPTLKEEADLNEKPSFVNSKHGWFALSFLGLLAKAKASDVSTTKISLMIKDQTNERSDTVQQTRFSDTVAIQMYRIAFLLLKFLCMQAKAAAKRAEELEFIDLAQFPELPMPEILHGLQDQAIAIVTEVCKDNRQKPTQPETEGLCILLLQILEKSLYLELCVSQSCGIRPVLGRVEDFSKEIKLLLQAVEQHSKFKASLRSLRQIIVLVYPGLLRTGSLI